MANQRVLSTREAGKILRDQFWAQVDKNGPTQPHMTTPCWLWTGRIEKGYGRYGDTGAHRIAFLLCVATIPADRDVLHRCDNPRCVRHDHLFLGTHAENMQDMVAKGRAATGSRNGRHTHPERTARGQRNGRYIHPETTARGARHGFRLHPETVARGEAAGRAKLKELDVLDIRRRFKEGVSQSALAREYGLSSRSVSAIVRGESWKHLPL